MNFVALPSISPNWDLLQSIWQSDDFLNTWQQVEAAYKADICYPPKDLIFNAFNLCPFDELKVVILGQDPYHGEGEAHGLCFSVPTNKKIPPSLVNIYKELLNNYNHPFMPTSGDLTFWAKQGVLLLNTTLSVYKNQANSHYHFGWHKITDAIIELVSKEKQNVVFLLWGAFAQKKQKLIHNSNHLVLSCGHPSPLSANQGKWFGNKHFILTNEFLEKNGKTPINWICQ